MESWNGWVWRGLKALTGPAPAVGWLPPTRSGCPWPHTALPLAPPRMGHLRLLWAACASANLSQPVGMADERLLRWQEVPAFPQSGSGKLAGWMAPCNTLGPSFPPSFPSAPLHGAHCSPPCLGTTIWELWRKAAILCIGEFLKRQDKVRAAASTVVPLLFSRLLPCRHCTAPHDAWGPAGH